MNIESDGTVLVVGPGSRQASIAWKLASSQKVKKIYYIGEIGRDIDKVESVYIDPLNFDEIYNFCIDNKVNFIMPAGGENYEAGIVDFFTEKGISIFGPTKKAARLESSKYFGKEFMQKHNIPTPAFAYFEDYEQAKKYIDSSLNQELVVKADGLVRGKGVVVCSTKEEAHKALTEMMLGGIFKDAGSRVLIEERVYGPEISVHILFDGHNKVVFPFIQDHKPRNENNEGPNTGGMGTYTPLAWVDESLENEIFATIINPTINGLIEDQIEFSGMIFPGLIITKKGPMVLEYNARFGAPETQSLMMLLESDLFELLLATSQRKLDSVLPTWKKGFAITVEVVEENYPKNKHDAKSIISNLMLCDGTSQYFYGSIVRKNDIIYAKYEKVMSVSVFAKSMQEALDLSEESLRKISFDGMYFRKDIGRMNIAIPEREK